MEENIDDEFGELYADVLQRFSNPHPISYPSAQYPLVEDPRIELDQSSVFGSGAGRTQVDDHHGLPATPDFGPGFDSEERLDSDDDDEKAEMGDDEELEFRGLDDRELGKNSHGTRVLMGNDGFDVGFEEREELTKIEVVGLNENGDLKNIGEDEPPAEPVQGFDAQIGHFVQKDGGNVEEQFHMGFEEEEGAIEARVLQNAGKESIAASYKNGDLKENNGFHVDFEKRGKAIDVNFGDGNFDSHLDDLDFDPAFIEFLSGTGDTVPGTGPSDFYGDSDARAFDPANFYGVGDMEERDSDSEDDFNIILHNNDCSRWDGPNENGNGKDLYFSEANEGHEAVDEEPQGEDLAADGENKLQCDEEKEGTKLVDAREMAIQSQDPSRRYEGQVAVSKSVIERSTRDVKEALSRDNPSKNVRADANIGRANSQPCETNSAGPGGSAWGFNSSKFASGARVDFRLPSHMRIFNVNVDEFEEKPWRLPGVDSSQYFNFGMDELKWKDYCGEMAQLCWESSMQNRRNVASERRQQQIGRAIEVQVGNDERLPSKDAKKPRLGDSGVIIEIVLQDSSNDGGAETKDSKAVSHVGTSTSLSTKGHKNIHGHEIQPFPLDSTPQIFSDIEHDNEERESQSSGSTDGMEEGEIMSDKIRSGDTLDEESLTLPVEKPKRISQFQQPAYDAFDRDHFTWSVRNTRNYIERRIIRGGGTRGRGVRDDLSRHRTQFDATRYRHKRNFNEREENDRDAYFPPGKKLGDHSWRNNGRGYPKYGRNYDNSVDLDYSRGRRRNVDYDEEDEDEDEKVRDGDYRPWKDFNQRRRENLNFSGQRRMGQPRMRYRGNLQHSDGYQRQKCWPNGKFSGERFDQPRKYNNYNNPRNERRPGSYNNNFNGDGGARETRWVKIDGQMIRRTRGNYQRGNQIIINSGSRNHVDHRGYCNKKVNAEPSSSRAGRNYSETARLNEQLEYSPSADQQDAQNHREDNVPGIGHQQDLKRGRSKLERWRHDDDWDKDSFGAMHSPKEAENEDVEKDVAVDMDEDSNNKSDLAEPVSSPGSEEGLLIKIGDEVYKL